MNPPTYHEHELACSECGHIQSVRLWQRLDAQGDREARELLFKGLLNVLVCTNCNHQAPLLVPLWYFDIRLNLSIIFHPSEALGDPALYEQFEIDGSANVAPLPDGRLSNVPFFSHVVFSLFELVCYVTFRERLHDHYRAKLTVPDWVAQRFVGRYKKKKIELLWQLGQFFVVGHRYTQAEVDAVIQQKQAYLDRNALMNPNYSWDHLRLGLLDLGLLQRSSDGSQYWRPDALPDTAKPPPPHTDQD